MAIAILLGLAGFLTGYATAGETGHYVSGVEGIKAASVPPPGMYLKSYNAFYTADELTDKDGDNAPVDFDLTVFVSAFRYIWVTDYTFFGDNFFVDATIPFIYTDIEIGAFGVDDDAFAVGDINIEPLGIAWHGNRFDAAFGFSVYAPTGKTSQTNSAAPNKDFLTAGIKKAPTDHDTGTGPVSGAVSWPVSITSFSSCPFLFPLYPSYHGRHTDPDHFSMHGMQLIRA